MCIAVLVFVSMNRASLLPKCNVKTPICMGVMWSIEWSRLRMHIHVCYTILHVTRSTISLQDEFQAIITKLNDVEHFICIIGCLGNAVSSHHTRHIATSVYNNMYCIVLQLNNNRLSLALSFPHAQPKTPAKSFGNQHHLTYARCAKWSFEMKPFLFLLFCMLSNSTVHSLHLFLIGFCFGSLTYFFLIVGSIGSRLFFLSLIRCSIAIRFGFHGRCSVNDKEKQTAENTVIRVTDNT